MSHHLEEKAQRWMDCFNKKDLHGLLQLYADHAVNAQPHLPAPIKGKAAIEEDFNAFMNAFPDGHMKTTSVVFTGDTLAMEWDFTGTHNGPLVGAGNASIPPTGRKVHVKGAEFTRHDAHGLIVDERGYFDLMGFMVQLGVVPPPSH